jgi:hypothetical protein
VPDANEDTTTTEVTEETNAVAEDENTDTPTDPNGDGRGDMFPREYVEKIRKESAGYRDRAKTADARVDELTRALFTARVAATGKLADACSAPTSSTSTTQQRGLWRHPSQVDAWRG